MPTQAPMPALFDNILIEPTELETQLKADNLLLIDMGSAQTYQQQHIPGAVNLDYKHIIHGMLPAPGLLPKPDRIQALVNALGITPDKTVVVYDDEGNGKAARLIWTLDCIGHNRHALLNGGIHSWVNEGHPIETAAVRPTSQEHRVEIDRKPIADIQYILDILTKPGYALLDARSAEEYNGQRGGGLRKGHIPGAVNMNWSEAIDESRNLRMMPKAQMLDRLANIGITPDKQIITYCYTHHRSAHTYVLLKHLGFTDVKGYDGSWSEWGSTPGLPIE